jgi:hypothetical protein
MVIPLRIRDLTHPRSFKEVCANSSPGYLAVLVKLDFNKLTEATEKFDMLTTTNSKMLIADRSVSSRAHLELLFFNVLALPNASSTGLDCAEDKKKGLARQRA